MKSIITSMTVAAGLMIAGSAVAVDMPALAKKNGCNACHAIDKKVVGPAWMDVSKAYNSNGETTTGKKVADILKEHNAKTAEEWLVEKVSKGGSGNWGKAAMSANDPKGKKQDDIKELVQFVLSLSK
jgi:cytochrome c551/c552